MNWTFYLVIFLSIVVVVSVVIYFFQERFLFHPEKLPEDFQFQYENQKVQEYNLEIKEGICLLFP